MKEKVQAKINQVKELAKSSAKPAVAVEKKRHTNDPLSNSIRNKKEADNFLAELNSIIAVSKK